MPKYLVNTIKKKSSHVFLKHLVVTTNCDLPPSAKEWQQSQSRISYRILRQCRQSVLLSLWKTAQYPVRHDNKPHEAGK